jgi:hypothetical protein
MKSQKGIAITELLIIIAILGILAAAIVPNLHLFIQHKQPTAAYEVTDRITGTIYQVDSVGFVDGTDIINLYVNGHKIELAGGWSLEEIPPKEE